MTSLSPLQVQDFAQIDIDRAQRIGMPEVVYGPQKTPEEIVAIVEAMLRKSDAPVLVTRCNDEVSARLLNVESVRGSVRIVPSFDVSSPYRTIVLRSATKNGGKVAILTAGTSDLRVAYEAKATLEALGVSVTLQSDVGVAGIDRSLRAVGRVRDEAPDAVIVVAGMEGALASVVGGMVREPVIAVPTSTGYGSSFEGITALLAMTASCAQGVSVVGIDNGFGAACAAFRICAVRNRSRAS
ncbi:MAG: nickel pincer cofactor biosynthesis protein LarB [Acidimicrobiales bacterium]